MMIKEYRIVMPLSMEEYQNGQLYSCAMASKCETGGGEGVEVTSNESFTDYPLMGGKYTSGQYTRKIYHISSRIPRIVRMLLPDGSLEVVEEAWNAFPYCKTIITNPGYMKENFTIVIESLHLPNRGNLENALELSPSQLAQREVINIDIVNDPVPDGDYNENEDPTQYHSAITGRGPLSKDWILNVDPVMTCYKVVSAEFKWLGIQTRVENLIHQSEKRLFTRFHRQIFCWMDKWYDLSTDEIRAIEDRVRDELNEARLHGQQQGMLIEMS